MGRNTPAILVLTLSMVCLGVREAASAVIPVTTVEQKISATGGCSLQEAIYSSVLHDSFDGVHGMAISATSPDYFIQTEWGWRGPGSDSSVNFGR